MRSKVTHGIHDRVIEASLPPGFFQPVLIGLDIDKLERIGGYKLQINQLVARLEQAGYAAARIQPKMVSTLGADLEVRFEIGFKEIGHNPRTFATILQCEHSSPLCSLQSRFPAA